MKVPVFSTGARRLAWVLVIAAGLATLSLGWTGSWGRWSVELTGVASVIILIAVTALHKLRSAEVADTAISSTPVVTPETAGECIAALVSLHLLPPDAASGAAATPAPGDAAPPRELDVLARDDRAVFELHLDAAHVSMTYAEVLHRIAAVSRGTVMISDVSERQSRRGVRVSFVLNGARVSLLVDSILQGVDVPRLMGLNRLIEAGNPRLYYSQHDDSVLRLLFLSETERLQLGKRGWQFASDARPDGGLVASVHTESAAASRL